MALEAVVDLMDSYSGRQDAIKFIYLKNVL
jgi:hypothetical protein